MCRHSWVRINDVKVCQRCGLTIDDTTGKVMFDRNFANIRSKRKKGRKL